MKVSLKMEVTSETTVYRPLWANHSHFVHSLYQGDNPGVGSSKPRLLACLVRSRCADRLKRNNGWSRSSGCDACHLGTRCNSDADSFTDEGTRTAFTGLEKACLVLSGLGILLWATTGSPRLTLVASVSALCIGGVPTVVKAWVKPWTETMSGWLLMILGTVFSSLAIQRWTFDSGFLPVVIGLFQLSVALPLVLFRLNGSVRAEEVTH